MIAQKEGNSRSEIRKKRKADHPKLWMAGGEGYMDIVMEVRKELKLLADEKYRIFHSKLVPGKEHILGVRMPKLRQLAKRISAGEGWRTYLDGEPSEYYEEELLRGFIIGYARMPLEERLKRLKAFIPVIDNWAVCDGTCSTLKFTEKNKAVMWDFLQPYFHSDRAYDIRFASVMAMDYFQEEAYLPKVLDLFEQIRHDDYYVKMGVAWAVSMFYIRFPKEIEAFLRRDRMDDFTHNKAIQKIRESRRVTPEEKARLNALKRK